jgi:regulatory protein
LPDSPLRTASAAHRDAAGEARAPRGQVPSLRARALKLLAMREHGRSELARKLAAHAGSPEELHALLDELERAGHLSEQRFVESLIRRRGSRYGSRVVERELRERGVAEAVSGCLLRELAAGDGERAMAVWKKRFGEPPRNLAERARQQRFLAQRGFDAQVIASVFRALRDGDVQPG